jgi:hypothetical protein
MLGIRKKNISASKTYRHLMSAVKSFLTSILVLSASNGFVFVERSHHVLNLYL